MSTEEASAEAVIEPIEIPTLGCPETLMPTAADMKNMIKQIAALPAKITALIQVQAATMAQDEIDGLMSEVEQLQEVVEKLLDVIDAPNFKSIEWPDLRGEIGIDKLMQKYPTFLITEILKIKAPYQISISILSETKIHLSKIENNNTFDLINRVVAKGEHFSFNFTSTIQFEFWSNKNVNVSLNDISINNYLDNTDMAIRGSYEDNNKQLYISFYNR